MKYETLKRQRNFHIKKSNDELLNKEIALDERIRWR